jgi:hypothetical protein
MDADSDRTAEEEDEEAGRMREPGRRGKPTKPEMSLGLQSKTLSIKALHITD